jgi:hypothetical protein
MHNPELEGMIKGVIRKGGNEGGRYRLLNCFARIDAMRIDFVELGLDTDTLSHIDSRVQAEYDDLMERRAEND